MKKILIAVLLLVPLIIVFTLNTSASIVSAQIEIGVERMVLTHQGEVVDYVVINLEEYVATNKKYLLFVEFTPTYVSNKDVEWSSSDTSVAKVKKQGNGAVVSFVKGSYGSVEIIATATSNTSVSAACTFYVTGKELGRLELYDYERADERLSEMSLDVGECRQIGAKCLPIGSLGDNLIKWESSAQDVVTVDDNGVVKARSKGTAFVKASVKKDDANVSASLEIKVSGDDVGYKDCVYITGDKVALSQLSDDATVRDIEGAKIENEEIVLLDDHAWVTLERKGKSRKVYVARVADNAMSIDNYACLKQGMWRYSNYVTTGSGNINLSLSDAFTDAKLEPTWSSSDNAIVRVDNGRLFGVSHGKAKITAKMDGYADLELYVDVVEMIGDINFALSEVNDKAGLAERRVFGIYTCDKELNVSESLDMVIDKVYPAEMLVYDDFYDYLEFSSDNEDYAEVDAHGKVTFKRQAIGNSVTITVKAKHSDINASDSYTFKVVDGVNIGLGITTYYDKSVSTDMPDFTPYYEYRYVMEDYLEDYDLFGSLGALVFQSNVYLPSVDIIGDHNVSVNRPIEGNGFVIDGQLHVTEYDSHIFANGFESERVRRTYGDDYNMIVNNLYIQSYAPISDDSEEAFADLKVKGGIPYRIADSNEELANLTMTFKSCVFRYAYTHIHAVSGKVVCDGCIFSNSAGPAIAQHAAEDDMTTVTIRNCIFSNTISPVYLGTRGNIYGKTDEKYKYTVLNIEGNNYIYNWRLVKDVQMDIFPQMGDKTLDAILAQLNAQISDYLKEVLEDPANKSLIYKHPKGDYFNFGFMEMSIFAEHNLQINPTDDPELKIGEECSAVFFDEEKYGYDRLDFSSMAAKIDMIPAYRLACKIMDIDLVNYKTYVIIPQNKSGGYNTEPGETYNIDAKTKARLRGEAVK